MSNRLDPDQAQHFAGPDFGPNCLQRLLTEDFGRYRVILQGNVAILKAIKLKKALNVMWLPLATL